jgi:hypothetical protein
MKTQMQSKITTTAVLGLIVMLLAAPCWAKDKPEGTSPSRLKGMKAAIADLEKGTVKQKEYPALPYSPSHREFIRLLKKECAVEWQVVKSPDSSSKQLREEVDGYNDVMRAEIRHRFGSDIFEKLHRKAKANK